MLSIDHIYNKFKDKDNLKSKEILDIIELIENTSTFDNSIHSTTDLYVLFAKKSNDLKIIKKMIESQINEYRSDFIFRLFDEGNKTLFDEFWEDYPTFQIKMFDSKFTDAKQLEAVYNDITKRKNIPKQFKNDMKNLIFLHPNCPPKILNRQLKNLETLELLASRKTIHDKLFETMCLYSKVDRTKQNSIFDALLSNMNIDWDKISEGVDLKSMLKDYNILSQRRQGSIYKFFTRDDTPEKAKFVFYKITNDNTFMPKHTKELFMV